MMSMENCSSNSFAKKEKRLQFEKKNVTLAVRIMLEEVLCVSHLQCFAVGIHCESGY